MKMYIISDTHFNHKNIIEYCNRPLPDTMIKDGYINIHGHIHQKRLEETYDTTLFDKNKHINVSCDMLNFEPVLLEELLKDSDIE